MYANALHPSIGELYSVYPRVHRTEVLPIGYISTLRKNIMCQLLIILSIANGVKLLGVVKARYEIRTKKVAIRIITIMILIQLFMKNKGLYVRMITFKPLHTKIIVIVCKSM